MKKFFSVFGKAFKWIIRLGIIGLILFVAIKYIQATFFYEPEPTQKIVDKRSYLDNIEPGADAVAKADPATMRVMKPIIIPDSLANDSLAVDSIRKLQAEQMSPEPEGEEVRKYPNVILIVMDDLGYGDLGSYGNKAFHTPNMDSLAAAGVSFDQYYVPSPEGTPSRAALFTGRYPVRSRMTHTLYPSGSRQTTLQKAQNLQLGILEDEILLPEPMKQYGYVTGLIGKWHLGDTKPHLPTDLGFDEFFGVHVSHDMEPMHLYQNDEIIRKHPIELGKLTSGFTEEAVRFIETYRDDPFFLTLAYTFPHLPLPERGTSLSPSRGGLYGDVVESLDEGVGEVMEALQQLNLDENTLIILTSDNGPSYLGSPGPHRGRKYEVFEGGVKVPCIMWYPGALEAGMRISDPVMSIDLFPTILSFLDLELPGDRLIDGMNLWPLLNGEKSELDERSLYYFWREEIYAIRSGRFKYHIKHPVAKLEDSFLPFEGEVEQGPWLFDLKVDPAEAYNLSETQVAKSKEMQGRVEAFSEELEKNPRAWIQ